MFRAALVPLVLWAGALGAAEPTPLGALFTTGKGETALVAKVAPGSLAQFMGFREDDRIVEYRFTNKGASDGTLIPRPKLNDIRALTAGQEGRYAIVLERGPAKLTIRGELVSRQDPKNKGRTILVFVRDP
jgi:hypothetical protein